MMYRNYESLFPVLKELQIGFVAFSPLANGFLTCRYDEYSTFEKSTDYRSIMPQFSSAGIVENQKLIEMLLRLRFLWRGCWQKIRFLYQFREQEI